jgi:hypothetical protein
VKITIKDFENKFENILGEVITDYWEIENILIIEQFKLGENMVYCDKEYSKRYAEEAFKKKYPHLLFTYRKELLNPIRTKNNIWELMYPKCSLPFKKIDEMKYKIYLDDLRTPNDPEWILVKNYDEFVEKIKEIGLLNISTISLDHDLGDSAISEYFNNVEPNYLLNYDNIKEKTGLDCAKWLINHYFENRTQKPHSTINGLYVDTKQDFTFPQIYSHSANPIGRSNIIGYVNNFLKNMKQPQTCDRSIIPYKILR